jgi:plasmid stability protein
LHVRDVPDALHSLLVERAQREQRSIGAEVITLSDRALMDTPEQQAALLDGIRRRRARRTLLPAPDSVALMREDRDHRSSGGQRELLASAAA